jgi:hypothetical protein
MRLRLFKRRKRKIKLSPQEAALLERENEIASRGQGNPFPFGGLDPLAKVIGAGKKMSGSTPILGTPLEEDS